MSVRTLALVPVQRAMFTRQFALHPVECLGSERMRSYGRGFGVAKRCDTSLGEVAYVLRLALIRFCRQEMTVGVSRPVSDFQVSIQDLLTNARALGLRTVTSTTLSNPKASLVEAFVNSNASMIKMGHFLRLCPVSKKYYLSLAPGARELLIQEWNENIHNRDEWYFQNAYDSIWNTAPVPEEYGEWPDAPVPDDYGMFDDRSTVYEDADEATDDHSWYGDDEDDEEFDDEELDGEGPSTN